ncbi:hypothetical protein HC762_01605, partial [bacterium]|nr:hypothetical protein [bacterium]
MPENEDATNIMSRMTSKKGPSNTIIAPDEAVYTEADGSFVELEDDDDDDDEYDDGDADDNREDMDLDDETEATSYPSLPSSKSSSTPPPPSSLKTLSSLDLHLHQQDPNP